MGIIARQSVRNIISHYWGILAGGIYTVFFIKEAFHDHPEYYGLIVFMINYMQILLPAAELSMPNVVIKFFPKYAGNQKAKSEFVSLVLMVVLLSCTLISLIYLSFGHFFQPKDHPELFRDNYLLIIPLLLFSALFETYASISKVILKSSFPTFLKEAFSKSWIFLTIVLYWTLGFGLQLLLWLYVAGYFLQFVMIVFYLSKTRLVPVIPGRLLRTNGKEIARYVLFTLMGGSAALMASKLDNLMIAAILGLEFTAYYAIGLFLSNVVQVPERSVSVISIPYISKAWEQNDLKTIREVYIKTSINQFIGGASIFLLIWINMDSLQIILGEKFGNIRYVFLFLSLAKLIDMISGANGGIIITSSRYKLMLYLQLFLMVLVFLSNLILIPRYGINGAALATAGSMTIYTIAKFFIVWHLFKMQPFGFQTLLAILLMVSGFVLSKYLPSATHILQDILLRTLIFSAVFFPLMLAMRISADLNQYLYDLLRKIRSYLKGTSR